MTNTVGKTPWLMFVDYKPPTLENQLDRTSRQLLPSSTFLSDQVVVKNAPV
jgi:hypothetical protein